MFTMMLFAIATFAADLGAVAITVGALMLERRLGLGRGVALDAILVLITCYGLGAWLLGRALARHFVTGAPAEASRTRPA
jgi:hypothetical protein